MSVRVSSQNRTFTNGVALSDDIHRIVIDKLLFRGASTATRKIPRGLVMVVAKELQLSNPTISKIWKYFVINNCVSLTRFRQGPRILSPEDEEYIRQLILMKPTLYKREICDLLLQNRNSDIRQVSMTTIFDTVCYRISSKQFTYKRTQRSNQNRLTAHNLYYTHNFLNFIQGVDPYTVRFVDEASVNYATS